MNELQSIRTNSSIELSFFQLKSSYSGLLICTRKKIIIIVRVWVHAQRRGTARSPMPASVSLACPRPQNHGQVRGVSAGGLFPLRSPKIRDARNYSEFKISDFPGVLFINETFSSSIPRSPLNEMSTSAERSSQVSKERLQSFLRGCGIRDSHFRTWETHARTHARRATRRQQLLMDETARRAGSRPTARVKPRRQKKPRGSARSGRMQAPAIFPGAYACELPHPFCVGLALAAAHPAGRAG